MIRQTEAEALPISPAEHWDASTYVAKAKRFYCSNGYDMLNIDISHDGVVVARYFADPVEKEYKGFLIGKKWKRIKLKNLIQLAAGLEPKLRTDYYYYSSWVEEAKWTWDPSSTTEGIIGGTLNMGVDQWENSIESRKYYSRARTKYERLQERIGALMKPVPDGFKEWVDGLLHEEHAVLKREILGDYVYQCTECKTVWAKRKYKYREKRKITCPHCGKELIVKNNTETERVGIYLFQTCNDGTERWYERYISVHKEWDPDKSEWQTILNDMNLAVIKSGERYGKLYYREGTGYSETSYNGQLTRMGKGYIYPDFGGAENLMSDHQKYCLKELADRAFKVNANKVIISPSYPGLEYLLKGRYDKLAMEMIEDRNVTSLSYQATNIQDFLRIDKQRCLRLRQINGGSIALEWLRYEKVTEKKVSAEAMAFFMKYNIDPNDTWHGTRKMLSVISSPTAFKNYLEKQSALSGDTVLQTISTYDDYYSMAVKQGLNMANEMFYKPKHLKAAHDECVRVAHEKEYEKRAAEIVKKFPDVPEILKDIREKYEYEGEKFTIIVPERIEDIIAEGRALGHCIDTSDRYFDRIQKHVTYLVFLRRSSSKTAAWYTLEIEPNGTVRQQRTTGNNQNKADTAEYMPFIREWQQVVKQRMSEEDRKNAELSKQIRIEEYKELREKKEPVRSGLLAGKLLVDVLEADLVEAI